MKYIAIDLETTDSDHAKGDIIQIGAVIVNEKFEVLEEWNMYIRPTSPYRNPEAMKVNKISEDVLTTAEFPDIALNFFERFCLSAGDRPMLAAWGTYFDIVFLREYYRKIGRDYLFSYRCLDLKSIAVWEEAKRGLPAEGGLNTFMERAGITFEGTPHDALADITNTVRLIQSYL